MQLLQLYLLDCLEVTSGVPQGSILGPLYINDMCSLVRNNSFHYYADDTIIYSLAPSVDKALSKLKSDFYVVQKALSKLKLSLNSLYFFQISSFIYFYLSEQSFFYFTKQYRVEVTSIF